MSEVNPGDIVRITSRCRFNGADIQNVFHVLLEGIGSATFTELITAVGDWLEYAYSELTPVQKNDFTYQDYEVENVTTSQASGSVPWPSLTTGELSDDGMPGQDCCLALLNTGFARHQGRKYTGGYTEANQTSGYWTNTVTTAVASYVTRILTPQLVATGLSFYNGAYKKTPYAFRKFVTGAVTSLVASQRRRRPGVGS